MRYYLSNRQLKELANGKALQIALPDPGPDVVPDGELLAWAQSVVAGLDGDRFRRAVRESIPVYRQRGDSGQQLADEIGVQWLDQTPHEGRLVWYVEVVVVTLCCRERPRSTYPVQWPARYEI